MANEPFTSVVVAYFFPVSVLVAVTPTPGSGTAPAFTVPVIVPPLASTAVVGAGAGEAGAVVVVCPVGAACPQIVPTIIRLTAIDRIDSCTCLASLNLKMTDNHLNNLLSNRSDNDDHLLD